MSRSATARLDVVRGLAARYDDHTLVVDLPIPTISGANAREHWASKARRVEAERGNARVLLVKALRDARLALPPLPIDVRLVRRGIGTLDDDNLRVALKHVRDGLADELGLKLNRRGHADDSDARVSWAYAQEKIPRSIAGVPQVASVRVELRHRDRGATR